MASSGAKFSVSRNTRTGSRRAASAVAKYSTRRRTQEDEALRLLGQFDALRNMAAKVNDADLAEQISDRAWALVEDAEPVKLSFAREQLGVADQTVRDWMGRGLLVECRPDSGSGPIRVTLDSLAEVKEITDELREMHEGNPRLVSAVVARLEGEALSQAPRFQKSLEQMRRGERGTWPDGF